MVFTSIFFLFFFIVIYLLYIHSATKNKKIILVASSFLFYAAWSFVFALHFLLILLINYFFIYLFFTKQKPYYFPLILAINILNLLVFKYLYLLLSLITDSSPAFLFDETGGHTITLPLAISFYTFQLVAFQVDLKKGLIKTRPSLAEFFLFVMFFPQLVAGPIMRHSDFFHQIKNINPDENQTLTGSYYVLQGVVKKILIADNLAPLIDPVFQNPAIYKSSSLILSAFAYIFRLYCDFSGYTDIARGLGRLMGIDLPENFRGPYLSQSLTELWRRWHITLSSWLRDYVYYPLGGSKTSVLYNFRNLFITFLLGGIWHGANWTFLLWGAFHGMVLVLEKTAGLFRKSLPVSFPPVLQKILPLTGIVYTLTVFSFSMIFFNSSTIQTALAMTGNLTGSAQGMVLPSQDFVVFAGFATLIFNYIQYHELQEKLYLKSGWTGLFFLSILAFVLLSRFAAGGSEFIYFQF